MPSKKIFLFLTIVAAMIIGWPHLHFQDLLAQGDLGRDLCTFEQVFHGKLVYKDIWWVYGPLMPYYYGLFYLLFGFKISSILLGKFILNTLCGIFFYLASTVIMPAAWAFLASCFFLLSQQDFFFTYNHIAAMALTLAVFWLLLRYIYETNLRLGWWALLMSGAMGVIKINFGLSALLMTLFTVAITDLTSTSQRQKFFVTDRKIFYVCGLLIIPAIWAGIYIFFLKGLTLYEIRQCFPYFGDDQPYHQTPFTTMPYYLTQQWLTFYHAWLQFKNIMPQVIDHPDSLLSAPNLLLFTMVVLGFLSRLVIHGSTIAGFILSFSKSFDDRRRKFWLVQIILWSFFVINLQEFVVSGVWYRTFWSQPFTLFFSFLMISTAMAFSPRWLRYIIGGMWVVFFSCATLIAFASIKSSCAPDKFLNMPRGQIYVGNESAWVDTVNTVTAYLNQTLKKDELFFAMPYDCIYYYLTGRESPTRQLIFFDHIKIPSVQEVSVIKELKQHQVNYVLISNRIASSETGLGIFGKTYCPLIYQYIMSNFTPIWRYGGNWQAEPGWANNHGVIIFKRK